MGVTDCTTDVSPHRRAETGAERALPLAAPHPRKISTGTRDNEPLPLAWQSISPWPRTPCPPQGWVGDEAVT
eukprot:3919516-Prymnesium_polylepis.1